MAHNHALSRRTSLERKKTEMEFEGTQKFTIKRGPPQIMLMLRLLNRQSRYKLLRRYISFILFRLRFCAILQFYYLLHFHAFFSHCNFQRIQHRHKLLRRILHQF